MTVKEREHLLINVNRAFRDGGDYARRYDLYRIGESLLLEWKDLDYKECRKHVSKLCADGTLHFSK